MGKASSSKVSATGGKTVISSLSGSLNIYDGANLHSEGVCGPTELFSRSGKRKQLIKMLSLAVLPILALWAYTIYTLADFIESKHQNEMTRDALDTSIILAKVIHRLQRERDMTMLYLSALGSETKTFLISEYLQTDTVLQQTSKWPVVGDRNRRTEFETKQNFEEYLARHRQLVTPTSDPVKEMYLYTALIDRFILWLLESITESKFAVVWKSVVAYQKIASGKEDVGLERALGTMFFARGSFPSSDLFDLYSNRIFTFQSQYETARLYSDQVDFLFSYEITYAGVNITDIIYDFRQEIQYHNTNLSYKSIQKAKWLFDNMTLYMDLLFDVQQSLGSYAMKKVNKAIEDSSRNLQIFATLLAFVILICPIVIFATENLTSDIQRYALTLVDKTKELTREKKRTDSLLYQMVPKPVAEKLKNNLHIDAEYFHSVTVLFCDIFGFSGICAACSPMEIIHILNHLYGAIDDILDNYDVYKVETVNDCYMVVSGLPNRNGKRHVTEIADFSIALIKLIKDRKFITSGKNPLMLCIGINTGPCMAGIVGSIMPRYCLFGDTVNTASRMKTYSHPNKIHVSQSTFKLLSGNSLFVLKKRGSVIVKGKGEMKTYWLQGKSSEVSSASSGSTDTQRHDIPGEIMGYEDTNYRFAFGCPPPGQLPL